MAVRYTKVNESYEAKVQNGYLYVRETGRNHMGVLVRGHGERAGAIYRMPYTKSLEDAMKQPTGFDGDYMNAVDNCAMGGKGEIIKQGRLIP